MTNLQSRKISDIVAHWHNQPKSKPSSIPSWCWARPYAEEPYYMFMHQLVQIMQAKVVVELGIDTGTSSVFLATASPSTRVISIEIDPDSVQNIRTIAQNYGLTNLTVIQGSTIDSEIVSQIKTYSPIDILFIDTLHTLAQASLEYQLYAPLMASNGIVAHDDIDFNSEMRQYWNSLPAPKMEVPELHWTNFGLTGGE
jgi:predicted O-methyltransferase YrrM